jgi:alanyl-tRNA synthetase
MQGASLIPADPTVLLTIAGMLQFKPIFLGQAPRSVPRATTTQKCVRVSDIENIGVTARHHTFFEVSRSALRASLACISAHDAKTLGRVKTSLLHACLHGDLCPCDYTPASSELAFSKGLSRRCGCDQMLGNFSFGDYFKAEAIQMAWELSTKVLGIPASRIWVSVYEQDEEAAGLWRDMVGFPAERLVRLGDEDNFWASG